MDTMDRKTTEIFHIRVSTFTRPLEDRKCLKCGKTNFREVVSLALNGGNVEIDRISSLIPLSICLNCGMIGALI